MEHHAHGFWDDPATWVAVAFILFFILFGSKVWAALTGLLDNRANEVRNELAEAQRLRSEAEAMLRDATARREQTLVDAQRLLEGARAQAAHLAAATAADAEASARRRERMALDRIAAAEKAAVDEVRIMAAEVAASAAEQVLRDGLTPAADAVLVDRAIGGLASALASRRAA